MNTALHPFLLDQPRWVHLGAQAYTYGFLCWLADCLECGEPIDTPSVAAAMTRADETFESWPAECFEHLAQSLLLFLAQEPAEMTNDRLDELYGQAEDTFRDHVSADLLIFTTLATGEPLTEEQWTRLWAALAFDLPLTRPKDSHAKTRRVHGRRAITPMRRHKRFRAITLHKRPSHPQPSLQVVKEG